MAFKKGQSGNPKGRTPAIAGVNDFRKSLASDMPKIIKKLTEMALSGDMAAAKLLLDRTYPALKPQSLPVELPQGENLSQTGENIINSTLAGQMPPEIGSTLLIALSNHAKIIEQTNIIERLEVLEKHLEK